MYIPPLALNLLASTGSIVSCLFFFFLLFFLGYRGIVHPPSDDGGTERTWFEPEHRPKKILPKRSVHGKQDVHSMLASANKDTRQMQVV